MAKKRCPKCGGTKFLVKVHATQRWLVDENGNFISCTCDCEEVTHGPDDDDLCDCAECGYQASGKEFNIE